MMGDVPSPWVHEHKATSGTSLSTSESNLCAVQNWRDYLKSRLRAHSFVGIPPSLFYAHALYPLHHWGVEAHLEFGLPYFEGHFQDPCHAWAIITHIIIYRTKERSSN